MVNTACDNVRTSKSKHGEIRSEPSSKDEAPGNELPPDDKAVEGSPPCKGTAMRIRSLSDRTAVKLRPHFDSKTVRIRPLSEYTSLRISPQFDDKDVRPLSECGCNESRPLCEDETAGSRPLTEDDTAGSRPLNDDAAAGNRLLNEDEGVGSRLLNKDDTAGSRLLNEDDTAGSKLLNENETAGSTPLKEDDTGGSRLLTEDDTARSRPLNDDEAAGYRLLNEDEGVGSRLLNEDDTAGSRLLNEDDTAGSRLLNEDDTAGSKLLNENAADEDQDRALAYQCPICRNLTDRPTCDHVDMLMQNIYNTDAHCPVPEHAEENKLIAYCIHPDCKKPVCKICKMIRHKSHTTVEIGEFANEKRADLAGMKLRLASQQEKFSDAVKYASDEEAAFKEHVLSLLREMTVKKERNSEILYKEALNRVVSLIREAQQIISESLRKQSDKAGKEKAFLEAVITLADNVLTDNSPEPNQFVRVWMFLTRLSKDWAGEAEQDSVESDTVSPPETVKKRLILPRLDSVMAPGMQFLNNLEVGIEDAVLRKCFDLKADDELLQYHGILPVTETEALVLCKQLALVTSVVLYSKTADSTSFSKRHRINLKESGQYSFACAPGNSLLATLYQAAGRSGGGRREGKNQVLVWGGMLNASLKHHAANPPGGRGKTEAEEELKVLAETALPPRDVAVTPDNCLVVLTAEDPPSSESVPRDICSGDGDGAGGGGGDVCILRMTQFGDVLSSKSFKYSSCAREHNRDELHFPGRVSVNINGDIYVTRPGKDPSIVVFNGDLTKDRFTIRDPYDDPAMNDRFCPTDICHDSFGRLIVADNHNHCIIRIEMEDQMTTEPPGWQRPARVILKDGCDGVNYLNYPSRVALGPGHKLWVVCRDNVQVFDYMNSEW